MTRGPQPKPTKLRVLEGNPGKRRLNKNEVEPIQPLKMPDLVASTDAAVDEWNRLVNSMPSGFYTDADATTLTIHCMSWVMYRNALATLAREGMVTNGSTGQKVAHPSVAVADKMMGRLLQAADRLGGSPAARARINAPTPGSTISGEAAEEDDLLRG